MISFVLVAATSLLPTALASSEYGLVSSMRPGEIFCVYLAKNEPAAFDGFFTGGNKVDHPVTTGYMSNKAGILCKDWTPGNCIDKGGCNECEGSCQNDSSCRGKLKCWIRTLTPGSGDPMPGVLGVDNTDYPWQDPKIHMGVPGCVGTLAEGIGYCYDPDWEEEIGLDTTDCQTENAEQCMGSCGNCFLARELYPEGSPGGICHYDQLKNGVCQQCWGCVEGFYQKRWFGRNCWDYEQTCWPKHCSNGRVDSGESGIDCGGTCEQECYPTCKDDNKWESEWGDCDSYKRSNRAFCNSDTNDKGVLAKDACPASCNVCEENGHKFWMDIDGDASPPPTPPPSTPCPSPAPISTWEKMVVNDAFTGQPKNFYCKPYDTVLAETNEDLDSCKASCEDDSECRFLAVSRSGASKCTRYTLCFGRDLEDGMTEVDVYEVKKTAVEAPCNGGGGGITPTPPAELCFDKITKESAKHTCDKKGLIKKECSGGCSNEQCAAKCTGDCAFYAVSTSGVCKTFDECTDFTTSSIEWDVYQAKDCDDQGSPPTTSPPVADPTSPPAANPTSPPATNPTPPTNKPVAAPAPCSGDGVAFTEVVLETNKHICAKEFTIKKECSKNCSYEECAEKCEANEDCEYFGLDSKGICKTFTSCEETKSSSGDWEVYVKSQAPCTPNTTPTPPPTNPPTNTPADPPTHPVTTAPSDGPEECWTKLNAPSDYHVCGASERLNKKACSGCGVDECTEICENDPKCTHFSVSEIGICRTYEGCSSYDEKTKMWDNYGKASCDGVAPAPTAAPAPTPGPSSPPANPPANPPASNGDGFQRITTMDTPKTTCHSSQMIKKECISDCTYEFCSEKCKNNSSCTHFGLSSSGMCKTFTACDVVGKTGKVWDTYAKL